MDKEELIELLKKHRENEARLRLRKKEKVMYERRLKSSIEIEISTTSSTGINQDIRSKNKISDKVGDTVVNTIQKNEEFKIEAEKKINELIPVIEELESLVEEGNIRLGALYYKEREILTAYYVDNREAEEIGRNLYFRLYNRTCTADNIYKIVKRGTDIMLRL